MGRNAQVGPETVDRLLARGLTPDPARPLLTWYDDGTGERVELSGTTLANWVAKTANLLVDGGGLGPGDRAAVLLPPHWQTAAVLLGCWSAGLSVGSPPPFEPVDVLFAATTGSNTGGDTGGGDETGGSPGSDGVAGERFALGLAPMGLPLREVPAGFVDYIAEVRGHGDHFTSYHRIDPADPARHGPAAMSHGELCAAAVARAADLGIAPGARVLIDAATRPDPVDWLLAPLAVGASVVLCGRLDPAAVPGRMAAERADLALTSDPR